MRSSAGRAAGRSSESTKAPDSQKGVGGMLRLGGTGRRYSYAAGSYSTLVPYTGLLPAQSAGRSARGDLPQEPGHAAQRQVWLNLIPYFDLMSGSSSPWSRSGTSLRAEYADRGWPPRASLRFGVGLDLGDLLRVRLCSRLAGAARARRPPGGLPVSSLASLILWIIYWVKISRLRTELPLAGATLGNAPRPPIRRSGADMGHTKVRRCPDQGRRRLLVLRDGLRPGDDFCRSCGSRLDAAVSAQDLTEPDTGRARRPGRITARATASALASDRRAVERDSLRLSAGRTIVHGLGSARCAGGPRSSLPEGRGRGLVVWRAAGVVSPGR